MNTSQTQYYLSDYGVSPQVHPQAQGPVYDETTLDYESMVGGEFGFGSDEVYYAEASSSGLAALEGGHAPSGNAGAPGELDALDGLVNEAGEVQVDPQVLLKEIQEELKKKENRAALPEGQLEDFEAKLEDLEKQALSGTTDPQNLAFAAEELKEALRDALEEGFEVRGEKIETARGLVEGLLQDVEKSKLNAEQKEAFRSRLEGLQDDLSESDVDLEELRGDLEEIHQELGRETRIAELKRKMETLPSKIPTEGWHKEQTVELANLVVEALRTDSWGKVKEFLKDQRDHHKNQGNNFVPQFIGTIFMDLAGSDEDQLDQYLALIPSEVRELMAEAATQEDVNSTEHLDDPLKYQYYGRPSATAERLRSSRIDEALDQVGGESLPE